MNIGSEANRDASNDEYAHWNAVRLTAEAAGWFLECNEEGIYLTDCETMSDERSFDDLDEVEEFIAKFAMNV